MSEIPEDVMQSAREFVFRMNKEWGVYHSPTVEEVKTVALAILAERERCAQIASSNAAHCLRIKKPTAAVASAGIAAAIRGDHQ